LLRGRWSPGVRPVLAGRNQDRLNAVATRLSQTGDGIELDTAVADTERPELLEHLTDERRLTAGVQVYSARIHGR
jgi:short-subunit dehydrogenase